MDNVNKNQELYKYVIMDMPEKVKELIVLGARSLYTALYLSYEYNSVKCQQVLRNYLK